MKKIIIIAITLLLILCLISVVTFAAEKKLAQSGFQFLSVVSDAKASAMADAMTSLSILQAWLR
jgi:TM2 domain-containing membrane protein YozV